MAVKNDNDGALNTPQVTILCQVGQLLTHCGLLKLYGNQDQGHHWLK